MILSDKEKKRLIDSFTWMITDMQYKNNEEKRNFEVGSAGGYSSELEEAMSLLEDIKKTETTEVTGCHRKLLAVNCREFTKGARKGCISNRQGTCALSRITLESVGSLTIGILKCVQAKKLEKEGEKK
jgi:hypothetical protein